MSFADFYFNRYKALNQVLEVQVPENLQICVTIPVYNEPNLLKTIESLYKCEVADFEIEIIVVINSRENESDNILNQNELTKQELELFKNKLDNKQITLHIINIYNIQKNIAGPGYARKVAMDTALSRFNEINNSDGIIVSLDADTIVEKNYFTEIVKFFKKNPKVNAADIYFEHPLNGTDFNDDIYKAIVIYELYLRYYIEALRYCSFPYAYHTIGSAFAVKASVYAKHGGMVLNNSGEDFYFLQKIIPSCSFGEINSTKVIPSPRITDRVIFGTGVAVYKIINDFNFDFPVYTFDSFVILKQFISQIPELFQNRQFCELEIDKNLKKYLIENEIETKIEEIKKNTNSQKSFGNRFFRWFNSLKVLKFLNLYNSQIVEKNGIIAESIKLFNEINLVLDDNPLKMLELLREKQRKSWWKI